MTRPLHRRDFLHGIALGVTAAPFLRMAPARAATAATPSRLVIFYSPGGAPTEVPDGMSYLPDPAVRNVWLPPGVPSQVKAGSPQASREFALTSLSPILSPLEAYKSRLVLPVGLEMRCADGKYDEFGSGHNGFVGMLTSARSIDGFNDGDVRIGSAGGPSVDQYIAQRLGNPTPFASLELAAQASLNKIEGEWHMSYADRGKKRDPDENPFHAFGTLFGDAAATLQQKQDLLTRRKSVLDFALRDLGRLRARLGAVERQRLDAHSESLRALEKNLEASAGALACSTPSLGTPLDVRDELNYPAVSKLQADVLVAALACDRTRVATLQLSDERDSSATPIWLKDMDGKPITDNHHVLQHDQQGDPVKFYKFVSCQRWYAEQFAYIVGKLQGIPEADGSSMLDHTTLLWISNLANPFYHANKPMPWVLAGGGGGLRTGRAIVYANDDGTYASHADLLVSLCNLMGVPTQTFGDPALCNGPLPYLV